MEEIKRLYRSETDKMLGGVCGGFAEYLTIDSSIVRILFVLFSLWGGSGVLVYFVLWLIIPSKSSAGIIGEETLKENSKDMENVAKKVVSSVEEKVNSTKASNSSATSSKKRTASRAKSSAKKTSRTK